MLADSAPLTHGVRSITQVVEQFESLVDDTAVQVNDIPSNDAMQMHGVAITSEHKSLTKSIEIEP